MSIDTVSIKFFNNGLLMKKTGLVVTGVLISCLLGACSGNNAGAAETVADNTSTGAGVTDGTTGTGTGSGDSSASTGGGSSTAGGDGSASTGGGSSTGSGDGSASTGGGSSTAGGDGSASTGDGSSTFPSEYTKLDVEGNALPADSASWSCVMDESGKVWEIKSDDGGLLDKDWLYQYDGSSGLLSVGTDYPCTGIYACNPMSYIEAMNIYSVCGKSDWHLPTGSEMGALADAGGTTPPYLNSAAFPNTLTDAPYCLAKDDPGHYQGMHFGVSVAAGSDLSSALRVSMSDYNWQCHVLAASN